MTLERFVNFGTSTLASAMDASQTTAALVSGASFPALGRFRIQVDAEVMIVDVRTTNALSSITRGAEGTTAAAHSSGATVTCVVTAAGLQALMIGPVGTTGQRPTPASVPIGQRFFDTSLGIPVWNDGTVWRDADGSTTSAPTPEVITTLTSASSSATFLTKTADMSIDVIELAAGSYSWQNVTIVADRTARPLVIRPQLGATVNFIGPASSSGSLFNFNGAKWITWDGSPGAMVFKNFALAQSGVFQPQGSDHLTFRYLTFQNLSRDGAFSDQPYKSWCFYNSTGLNDHMLIDHCTFAAPAVSRDISAIQYASSGTAGTIVISNCTFTNYHYALYIERPTTSFLLDTWTMTNCGHSVGPFSIRFTAAVSIAGTYKNIVATSSDPLADGHTGGGVIVNGGGNSGI